MKQTMRFLARLYPSSWRERYGAEFGALLEDAKPSLRDALDVFRSFEKANHNVEYGPNHACMFICRNARGGRDSLRVARALRFANGSLRDASRWIYIHERIWTPSDKQFGAGHFQPGISGASVIQEHNLYPRERARMPLSNVIDEMKRNITLEAAPSASPGNQGALTFVVKFRYSDGHLAQQVNEELISRVMEGIVNAPPQLHSCCTFRVVNPPSIPIREPARNRTQFVVVGLVAGLLAGLALAIVFKSRLTTTV
jgi:hypothetical protein